MCIRDRLNIVSQNKQETTSTGQVRGLSVTSASCDISYFIDGNTDDGMNLIYDVSSNSGGKLNRPSIGGGVVIEAILSGLKAYNPASMPAGGTVNTSITVSGARAGDFVSLSFSQMASAGVSLYGSVTSNDIVTATFKNDSGGVVDLASGELSAIVTKLT